MSRSVKKGPFVDARLLGRVDDMNKRNERKVLKTWSRASVIFPQMTNALPEDEGAQLRFEFTAEMERLGKAA